MNKGNLIKRCQGGQDYGCGIFDLCIPLSSAYHIGIMTQNQQYNISIFQPWTVNTFCNGLSTNSILTLRCKQPNSTLSPSPSPTKLAIPENDLICDADSIIDSNPMDVIIIGAMTMGATLDNEYKYPDCDISITGPGIWYRLEIDNIDCTKL